MLVYLLQGLGFGFAAAVQPGPLQTYLISQALARGWRRTLPAALAPLISDGPIIVLVLLVLSQMPIGLQRVLYVAGGVFILYLAYRAFRPWRHFSPAEAITQAQAQDRGSVLKAAFMNLLNPNPYIYWSLVTGPILLTAWRAAVDSGIGFLAGFYGAMIGSLAAIIVIFATARRLGPGVNRALLGLSAVALTCFGLYQLWLGLQG